MKPRHVIAVPHVGRIRSRSSNTNPLSSVSSARSISRYVIGRFVGVCSLLMFPPREQVVTFPDTDARHTGVRHPVEQRRSGGGSKNPCDWASR